MIYSKTYHSNQPLWDQQSTIPFNELILSWNGLRPQGSWTFWVSLKKNEWLKYAEWTQNGQRSFKSISEFAESHQDVVISKELCTSFKVKVEGDDLSQLHSLTAAVSNTNLHSIIYPKDLSPILLSHVPRQSQQILESPRAKDLCSPTSVTTALRYLCNRPFDPVDFASRSHDEGFDIYGNWILNMAESYNQSQIPCHVERLPDFTTLHSHLIEGRPVIVSIKGPIQGALLPYSRGHLLCIIGWDGKKVYCIDSAFPDNASTFVGYDLEDFLQAWGRRRNLAYVFRKGCPSAESGL